VIAKKRGYKQTNKQTNKQTSLYQLFSKRDFQCFQFLPLLKIMPEIIVIDNIFLPAL
jgi:hypothetical protein